MACCVCTGVNVGGPPRINCFELLWDVAVRWSHFNETATIKITSEGRPDWQAVQRVSQTGVYSSAVEQVYSLRVSHVDPCIVL